MCSGAGNFLKVSVTSKYSSFTFSGCELIHPENAMGRVLGSSLVLSGIDCAHRFAVTALTWGCEGSLALHDCFLALFFCSLLERPSHLGGLVCRPLPQHVQASLGPPRPVGLQNRGRHRTHKQSQHLPLISTGCPPWQVGPGVETHNETWWVPHRVRMPCLIWSCLHVEGLVMA